MANESTSIRIDQQDNSSDFRKELVMSEVGVLKHVLNVMKGGFSAVRGEGFGDDEVDCPPLSDLLGELEQINDWRGVAFGDGGEGNQVEMLVSGTPSGEGWVVMSVGGDENRGGVFLRATKKMVGEGELTSVNGDLIVVTASYVGSEGDPKGFAKVEYLRLESGARGTGMQYSLPK